MATPSGQPPATPGGGGQPGAFGPFGRGFGTAPGPAGQDWDRPTVTIATYTEYAAAQRAVDYLSDQGFPVEHTSIVGTNLRLVERVLGRMTTGRAALAGMASGAWFGLFIGLLLGIFSAGAWLAVVVAGIVIGAIWGAIFGAIAHAASRGQRDFTSRSMLQASEYAVTVTADQAEAAKQQLVRLNWQTGAETG